MCFLFPGRDRDDADPAAGRAQDEGHERQAGRVQGAHGPGQVHRKAGENEYDMKNIGFGTGLFRSSSAGFVSSYFFYVFGAAKRNSV